MVKNNPKTFGLLALAGVAVLVFVLVFFQPQKLFIDDEVDEALPAASAGEPAAEEPAGEEPAPKRDGEARTPAGPKTLASGEFRGLDHRGTGRALIVELPDGKRYLRFEDLDVENGPDLKVYLAAAPSSSDSGAFDDDFVNLGELKGNKGNQNYELPDDVDLSKYKSAVVWCQRFSVGFAVAPVET